MPLVTHFCGVCGRRVPPDDLDVGRAVMLNHVTYCQECAAKAGIAAATPARPAPSRAPSPAARARPEIARPRALPAPRRRSGGGSAVLVGGALAGTALLLVVVAVAILAGGSEAPRGGETATASRPADAGPVPAPLPAAPEPAPEGADGPAPSPPPEDPARREARDVLARVQGLRPDAGAPLADLLHARDGAVAGVEELRRISGSAESRDTVIEEIVRSAESVAADLERDVERTGESIYRDRVESVAAFVRIGNFDRARRCLEDVPSGLERTPWAARLQEEKTRVEAAEMSHLRDEALRREEGWRYLFTGESLEGWIRQGAASWALVDDPLGYRYLAVRNDGSSDAELGYVAPDGPSWKDYKLRVDVRGVTGDLVVRVLGPGGPTVWTGYTIPESSLPRGAGWWTLQIDIEGDLARILIGARVVHRVRGFAGLPGGFGLRVPPGRRLELRNLRCKVSR